MSLGWGEGGRKDWAWGQVPHCSDLAFLGLHPLKTRDSRVPASSFVCLSDQPCFLSMGKVHGLGK